MDGKTLERYKENFRKYRKIYNVINKVRHSKYMKKYYEEHKKEYGERYRKNYKINKNRFITQAKEWKVKNRDRYLKWTKEYYLNNRDKIRGYKRKYLQSPKGKLNSTINNHNRRTRIKRLTVDIIQRLYEDNIKQYGTLTCSLCDSKIGFGQDSIDHKIPVSKNGTNEYTNLQIAHLTCNLIKNNRILEKLYENN